VPASYMSIISSLSSMLILLLHTTSSSIAGE
jgi:hypothetical protein